jgi:hypothetical protein
MTNRYKDIKNIKMKPMCFENFPFAMTNKGELLPCCYCDWPKSMKDPKFQSLLKVSKVSDYDKIDDIFETKEWKEFYDLLTKDIPPCLACLETCGTKTDGTPIKATREDTHYDKEGNIVDYEGSTHSQRYTKEKK